MIKSQSARRVIVWRAIDNVAAKGYQPLRLLTEAQFQAHSRNAARSKTRDNRPTFIYTQGDTLPSQPITPK